MNNNLLISKLVRSKLIIIGLISIVVGNIFDYSIIKLNVDDLLVNIGGSLLFVGTMEFIFDDKSRKELTHDIIKSVRGNDNIHRLGLVDCLENSRDVVEINEWVTSKILIVGIHYSANFLEDFGDIIEKRISSKKKTIFCHVDPSGIAAQYLKNSDTGFTNPNDGINKIKHIIDQRFNNTPLIELIEHDRVLRYTFIYTESGVWIKMFTNSKGYANVPAIKFSSNSQLFDFVKGDITRMGCIK